MRTEGVLETWRDKEFYVQREYWRHEETKSFTYRGGIGDTKRQRVLRTEGVLETFRRRVLRTEGVLEIFRKIILRTEGVMETFREIVLRTAPSK